ncbi:MAG TPA: hypothetical protein VD968_08805, partial [Pyrinomonadaceae bacterium]|nr:hypothetical protein [Pyrinomonadaceae bacterium]
MMNITPKLISNCAALLLLLLASAASTARAQESLSAGGKEVYDAVKAASLTGGVADVKGLVLKRDRAEMT